MWGKGPGRSLPRGLPSLLLLVLDGFPPFLGGVDRDVLAGST